MKKIEKEAISLLEQILDEKIGGRMEVVLIKPQMGVDAKKYLNRGWYIFRLTDLPRFLVQEGVFKIDVRSGKPKKYSDPLIHVKGNILRDKAIKLITQLKSDVAYAPGQDFKYENGVLFLKLRDGTSDSLDFSKAEKTKKYYRDASGRAP